MSACNSSAFDNVFEWAGISGIKFPRMLNTLYLEKHFHVWSTAPETTVMIERRQESRARSDIAVRISGRDASGKPFAQSVVASSISSGGALLSGMEQQVRPGDLVLVEYEERRARFRIVWVRESESERKTQAAIQRLENEQCPWVGF